MQRVYEILVQGPKAVIDWFKNQEQHRTYDDMDLLLLAQNCWTKMNTIEAADPIQARAWAEAALVGYDCLVRSGKPMVADSAREDADALRSHMPLV